MTRQPSSRREEATTQKDLKKLQQREQRMLEKLAEAREAQARAMKRFAQAQARVLLVEGRLQAVRARLQISHHKQEASPSPAKTSDTREASAQTAAHTSPSVAPTATPTPVTQAEATHTDQNKREAARYPKTSDHTPIPKSSTQYADQPANEVELVALVTEMAANARQEKLPQTGELPSPDVLAEDLEDTERRVALPATPPATPTPRGVQQDQEEEALIATIIAITRSESGSQGESKSSARQAVQQAEQALSEVEQAILNGTLSGPEADTALRGAATNLSQARVQLTETGMSTTPKGSAQEIIAADIANKLPIMHDRNSRTQEPT